MNEGVITNIDTWGKIRKSNVSEGTHLKKKVT